MEGGEMGGSRSVPARPLNDPILAARLEAISQLAGEISERVAVMDRDFNVVYASTDASTEHCSGSQGTRPVKCYEALVHRHEPCDTCPAVNIFHGPHVQHVVCSTERDRPPCGMQHAFHWPIKTDKSPRCWCCV